MKCLVHLGAATALGAALVLAWPGMGNAQAPTMAIQPAPALTGATTWINSPPLTIEALRGKVVLVEFWTRECINCFHVLPHTKALNERYAKDGLLVIGVHTPEYDEERDIAGVRNAAQRLGVTWPVAVDNDYRIWNRWDNQYWPAIYLIDRDGRVVYRHVGEGDYDRVEERVRQLLGKT